LPPQFFDAAYQQITQAEYGNNQQQIEPVHDLLPVEKTLRMVGNGESKRRKD
jgi:hypothetical protein